MQHHNVNLKPHSYDTNALKIDLRQKYAQEFEKRIHKAIHNLTSSPCPHKLAEAIRYAVLGSGHRFRPSFCIAVSCAAGDGPTELTYLSAISLEFLHCASLIQDDMPCFDNSNMRRGKPSVHKMFGENTSILASDALIIGAFEQLSYGTKYNAHITGQLIRHLAISSGAPRGTTAGQAMEQEPDVSIDAYHDAKTAAFFEAATIMGALSVGKSAVPWKPLGRALGRAYQLADDINDIESNPIELGKPVGQDRILNRPSAPNVIGIKEARVQLRQTIQSIYNAIPVCRNEMELRIVLADFLKSKKKT